MEIVDEIINLRALLMMVRACDRLLLDAPVRLREELLCYSDLKSVEDSILRALEWRCRLLEDLMSGLKLCPECKSGAVLERCTFCGV